MFHASALLLSIEHVSPLLYLDPGSGSILIQGLIAAALGAAILIRTQWSRIKKWFGVKPSKPGEEEQADEDD